MDCYDRGLYCCRPDEEALIRYQAGKHQSQEDNEWMFWISTANGLVKFNPETYAMRTFTYTDGLHETQFNYSSSYKAPDGTLYMGTINGMISFNPRQFEEDLFVPPLYITKIHLPGDKHPLRGGGLKELRLPYGESTFTLSYVALSFTSPDAIRYAYMLEGSDTEWNNMDRNKDVTFANLAPGNYTFKVKSTNSSGVWQENEEALSIVIVPPFWATDWAYLVYGLLMCLLIVTLYHYKKAKLEKELYETKRLLAQSDEIFLDKFNRYIEANLTSERLTVEVLASEMNMSASSLYRKVKGLSGLSPVDFIRNIRLRKAVQLIQSGETRISEIAFKTGFSSPAYFSTCFQKQYGKSPSVFIKENTLT